MFEGLMAQRISAKLCFFIDGLDEYTATVEDLLDLINKLSRYPNIKICLSSRPHTEFIRMFGKDQESQLKLGDLTRDDICQYVNSRLNEDERYKELAENDAGYETLTEEVINKAQGVFLWVTLVIRSLLEGAQYYDRLDDMRKRLDTFPADLDGFFTHMLQNVPPIYLPQTAWTLQIALAAERPLMLTIYEFAEMIMSQPKYAINAKAGWLSEEDQTRINKQLPSRLDARCKGLLEVVRRGASISNSWGSEYEVHFLHRSVLDYMSTSLFVKEIFKNNLNEEFNALVLLGHAYLAGVKHFLQSVEFLDGADTKARKRQNKILFDISSWNVILLYLDNVLFCALKLRQTHGDIAKLDEVLDNV